MQGICFSVYVRRENQRKMKTVMEKLNVETAKLLGSVKYLVCTSNWVPEGFLRRPPNTLEYLSIQEENTLKIVEWGWDRLSNLKYLRLGATLRLHKDNDNYFGIEGSSNSRGLIDLIAGHCPNLKGLKLILHNINWCNGARAYGFVLWTDCPFKNLELLHLESTSPDIALADRCDISFPPTFKAIALSRCSLSRRGCRNPCDHYSSLYSGRTLHVGTNQYASDWQQMISVQAMP